MSGFRETFHSIERSIGGEFGAKDSDDPSEESSVEGKDATKDSYNKYHSYKEVEREGWRQGTVEHRDMPEGGREFDRYQEVFAFNPEELRGKIVLDLGAGPEAKLARGLRESGITEKTISLSPDYSIPKSRQRVNAANPEAETVAGLGQSLPLANESVDVVLGLHITEHQRWSELLGTIGEVARILKPGGTAHIGPTFLNEHAQKDLEENSGLKETLQALGVEMSLRSIPKTVVHHVTGVDTASARLALKPTPFDLTLRKHFSPDPEHPL